jgi:ketosteroid isomerase-like protein
MSVQDVEVVTSMVSARRRGDLAGALGFYAPEVELDQRRMPAGGIYHGRAGVDEFYTQWLGTWRDLSVDIERVIDAGEHIVAVVCLSGRGRGSGVGVEMRAVDVFKVRDGQIVHQVGYPDADEALGELGIDPG